MNRSRISIVVGTAVVSLWWIILNFQNEFDLRYLLFANFILVAVIALQLLMLHLLSNTKIFDLIATTFVALNLWGFALSTVSISGKKTLLISIIIAIIISIITRFSRGIKLLTVFSVIFLIVATLHGIGLHKAYSKNEERVHENQVAKYSQRNNVYLLVFDSLISEDAYYRIYGKKEVPWIDYLKKENFNVLPNTVAGGGQTITSFGNIFNFGNGTGAEMTGVTNPVYDYFKSIGYKTAFLSQSGFFGSSHGPLLDFFYPSHDNSKICQFASSNFLFGICKFFQYGEKSYEDVQIDKTYFDFDDFLKYRDRTSPWLTVLYIWYPGHSPSASDYIHGNDSSSDKAISNTFISRSSLTVNQISRFINLVRERDKDPIILVFGDHGSMFYRGEDNGSNAPNNELKLLDTYGVTFAIYPKSFCKDYFKAPYYLKNLFVDVLKCL